MLPQDSAVQRIASRAARNVQGWYDSNAEIGGVCDFCADPLTPDVVTWIAKPTMEAYALIHPETLGTATVYGVRSADWAACPKCDPVVALRDPEALADHVIANPGARAPKIEEHERARFRDDLVELYEKFFAGDARRQEGE